MDKEIKKPTKGQRVAKKPTASQLSKELDALTNDIFYLIKKSDRLKFDDGTAISCNYNGVAVYINRFEALLVTNGSKHIYDVGTTPYEVLRVFTMISRDKLTYDDKETQDTWVALGRMLVFSVCNVGGLMRITEDDKGFLIKEGLHRVVDTMIEYINELTEEGANAEPPTVEQEINAREDLKATVVIEDGFKELSKSKKK